MINRRARRLSAMAVLVVISLFADSTVETHSLPARSPETSIPDSEAGRALKEWLNAINSGEQSKMQAYLTKYNPGFLLEDLLQLRKETGGIDFLRVQTAEPLRIKFAVQGKNNNVTAQGSIEINADAGTPHIELRWIPGMPKGAILDDVTLDKALRAKVIDQAIAQLNENYIFLDVAKKMAAAVRAHQQHGDYDVVTGGERFANMLTTDFQAVSRDKHLSVVFRPFHFPTGQALSDPDEGARQRDEMLRENCAFRRVEILEHNIGYLKFDMFFDPDVCGATATAAMSFVANADAVIIDLRENHGGTPGMVALISTYLFAEVTHLNDLRDRSGNVYQRWTLPYVSGKRLADKPVFVLTSYRTASGAESFCYSLKNLKRATIIGETTVGAAHTVAPHRIDEHFTIMVPVTEAVNPICRTNWEGVGVEPDVKVAAADALSTARRLAVEKLDQLPR